MEAARSLLELVLFSEKSCLLCAGVDVQPWKPNFQEQRRLKRVHFSLCCILNLRKALPPPRLIKRLAFIHVAVLKIEYGIRSA